jgi:hypothetical protein
VLGLGLGCQLVSGLSALERGGTTAQGKPCAVGTECVSGQCADSVCCDAVCAGPCVACNLPGAVGSCTPQPVDTDPEQGCGGVAKCDGSGSCAGGVLVWSRRYGDISNQVVFDVAVDPSRSPVLVGSFGGSVDFGGGPMVAVGERDAFITKLTPDGTHLWSKGYGNDRARVTSVAMTGSGQLFVAGEFRGDLDFGSGQLLQSPTTHGGFLASFGPDGSVRWSNAFGGDLRWEMLGADFPRLAVGQDGAPVLVGRLRGTMVFDQPLTAAGLEDIYVAKFAGGDGAPIWSRVVAGDGANLATPLTLVADVQTDSHDNVLFDGAFSSTLNFGTFTVDSQGSQNVYVAKYTPAGDFTWVVKPTGSYAASLAGIGVDANDQVLFAGSYFGQPDFEGNVLPAPPPEVPGAANIFLGKVGEDGAHRLTRAYVGGTCSSNTDCTIPSSVAVDGVGNIIISGILQSSVDFGLGPLASAGSGDVFLAKLNIYGDPVYSKRWGDVALQAPFAAGIDGDGSLLVAGSFMGTLDFGGPSPLVSAGDSDAFIAKFEP